ncbi:MAG: acetyl-CoA carboxylase carboxyltransferase subunit alpha [Lachnospiraceae bacterium]
MFKKTQKKSYISLKTAPITHNGSLENESLAIDKEAQTEKESKAKPEVPAGLLKKCNKCNSAIFTEEAKSNGYICPKCNNYFRMNAFHRIEMVVEPGTFEPWDQHLITKNPLHYKGYEEKIELLQEKTKLDEAVITGSAIIGNTKVVLAVCDGRFLMASMGEVVGEKITRAIERAAKEKLPVVIFACSGGARMQEGIVSLMQMAKTAAALKRLSDAGQLYISILTDPTTGGVTASFAMLGDIILAEPGALIGFAGPRVIEQTIGQKLPRGFQRSEFLLEHGFIDAIVERGHMKQCISQILDIHVQGQLVEPIMDVKKENQKHISAHESSTMKKSMTPWERVQISRMKDRPVGEDYIHQLFTDFLEFHGDRYYKDDTAIIGGVARFHGMAVTVIAQAKGRNTKENIMRNFGMPSPEGYRKSLRLMKQAEKFNRPVICFVDTPGAFCGLEAEERGQGEAIARNLFELSGLKVPVLSVIIGEGGSGGALAMAVADEVWMLENSVYSILSPEGYASILWKDSKRAKEASEVMKLTASNLKELGMIERVMKEPSHYTVEKLPMVCKELDRHMHTFMKVYGNMEKNDLIEKRYQRFRRM